MSALADAGRVPRQHAWGIDALGARGHRVVLAPFHERFEGHPVDRASRALRYQLGQIDQELHALTRAGADVVYCAEQVSSRGLAVLPRSLRRGAALVSVVHHPLGLGPHNRRVLHGHDLLVALSERLRDDLLRDHGLAPARVATAPWGPDLRCPLYRPTGARARAGAIMSAGKTNRDLETLLAALAEVDAPAIVYDLDCRIGEAPAGVRLVRPGGRGTDPASTGGSYLMEAVLAQVREAPVVAIPIEDPDRLTGLSEINDALALAKPIVITRSPYTPIDVEAIGCGYVVDPGDVAGWVRALRRLVEDPDHARELGARGRAFAQERWSYAVFGERLVSLVEGVRASAPS